jgi:hypothetical protein
LLSALHKGQGHPLLFVSIDIPSIWPIRALAIIITVSLLIAIARFNAADSGLIL